MASQQNPQSRKSFKSPSLFEAPLDLPAYPEQSGMNLQSLSSQNTTSSNPAKINPIYKNVLKFPQGFEHLKYFGFNPHPDKIPDESLLFAEPFLYPDSNIPLVQKQIEFQRVKDQLWPILSEK